LRAEFPRTRRAPRHHWYASRSSLGPPLVRKVWCRSSTISEFWKNKAARAKSQGMLGDEVRIVHARLATPAQFVAAPPSQAAGVRGAKDKGRSQPHSSNWWNQRRKRGIGRIKFSVHFSIRPPEVGAHTPRPWHLSADEDSHRPHWSGGLRTNTSRENGFFSICWEKHSLQLLDGLVSVYLGMSRPSYGSNTFGAWEEIDHHCESGYTLRLQRVDQA